MGRAAAAGAKMIGYTRVSTTGQAETGLGLDAQRASIEAAAAREGWIITAWESDAGVTGKTADRPGLNAALAAISAGKADGLVVAKLDRLARSVIDFSAVLDWFVRADRSLVVLDPAMDTSTTSGRLVANVFAAVAEWEADVIADRTVASLRAKRAAGQAISRPAVADHGDLVERIQAMRQDGMTMAAIADRLNADQVPTLRGGTTWRPSAVQSTLGYKRPAAARKAADLPPIPSRRTRRSKV